MVPVKKKNSDEIRITVNFSRLNAKMKDSLSDDEPYDASR